RGVDDDRDGVQGEDPLQDLNADGLITWMRYKDPEGTWLPDPTDGRAMVEADTSEGERGEWKLVREARDLDGDDEVGEDGALNAVVNHNFSAGWEEHQDEVGLWPGDEPEVRGLMEFVLAHKNLVQAVVYGEQGNLVKAPDSVADDAPAKMRVPVWGIRKSDATALERIAERYRDLTENETEGAVMQPGSFQRWAYEHRGLLVACAQPWGLPLEVEQDEGADEDSDSDTSEEAEEPEEAEEVEEVEEVEEADPSDDAKNLAWIDANPAEAWRFDAWESFEHPELGTVEIGGFAPFARTEPTADERADLAAKHFEWFLTLADDLPMLEIARFEKEQLGEGVWRVELVLENTGRSALQTRSMEMTRTVRPAKVALVLPEGASILAGQVQSTVQNLDPVDGRFEQTWLVLASASTDIRIEIDTDHAGDLAAIAEVK
ncbi:MAG: hypothetical protein ACI8QS_002131, partial [Planctomycetota bacterium]